MIWYFYGPLCRFSREIMEEELVVRVTVWNEWLSSPESHKWNWGDELVIWKWGHHNDSIQQKAWQITKNRWRNVSWTRYRSSCITLRKACSGTEVKLAAKVISTVFRLPHWRSIVASSRRTGSRVTSPRFQVTLFRR